MPWFFWVPAGRYVAEVWRESEVGRALWDALKFTLLAAVSFIVGFAYLLVAIPYALAVGSTPRTVYRRARR